jgi:hypothetical protein
MKMRIQGNAVRFRLTRREVSQFDMSGRVDAVIHFPDGASLTYALEHARELTDIEAIFGSAEIRVRVPEVLAREWAGTDRVSVQGGQPLDGGGRLEIVVEKDFQCLHKGEAAKDPEAYPNPQAV